MGVLSLVIIVVGVIIDKRCALVLCSSNIEENFRRCLHFIKMTKRARRELSRVYSSMNVMWWQRLCIVNVEMLWKLWSAEMLKDDIIRKHQYSDDLYTMNVT